VNYFLINYKPIHFEQIFICNFVNMLFKVEIYIPISRSTTYREVINRASRTGYYDPARQMLTFDSIIQLFRWWEDFSYVVWTAQKWAGFMVSVNEKMIIPFNNNFFYNLQDIKHCWYNRQQSKYQSDYCEHDCLGCHRLHSVLRHVFPGIMPYQAWYSYGDWSGVDRWQINKQDIVEQLKSESEMIFASACPAYSIERIEKEVAKLPDEILLSDDWRIVYRPEIGATGHQMIPVSITFNFESIEVPDYIPREKPTGKQGIFLTEKNPVSEDMDIDRINEFLDKLLKQKKRG
jgi:hypothetical protein